MTISERIKYIRLNQPGGKMSREAFGQKMGMTGAMVQNIEEAETRLKGGISDSTLRLIAATFRVNYQWLTEGKEPMFLDMDADSLVDRYAPDESEYFRATVRAAMGLSDEAWIKWRDFVEEMRDKLQHGDQTDAEP